MMFVVYGPPVPKARPRLNWGGRVYTPTTTKRFEELVAHVFQAQKDRTKLEGPVKLTVHFWFPRPIRRDGPTRTHHIKKPDLTNLIKAVEDGLNGLAYADDSQITLIEARKSYIQPGQLTRTEIILEPDLELEK